MRGKSVVSYVLSSPNPVTATAIATAVALCTCGIRDFTLVAKVGMLENVIVAYSPVDVIKIG